MVSQSVSQQKTSSPKVVTARREKHHLGQTHNELSEPATFGSEAPTLNQRLQDDDPHISAGLSVEESHPSRRRASVATQSKPPEKNLDMPNHGNGSIFKQKTKAGKTVWKVNISLGYDSKGRRKRTQRTAHSHSAAIQIQREMLALHLKGDLSTKSRETLEEYALWWLRTVKTGQVKQSTLADYEDRLRRTIFIHLGRKPIQDITARDVETWISNLKKAGLAMTSINGARQVLGAVMKHAARQGLIPKNPVELTDRLGNRESYNKIKHNPWTKDEAVAVLELCQNTDFDLFTHMALHLGLRRGEILGLEWEDFDFANTTLSIKRTLKELRTFDDTGKATSLLTTDSPKTRNSARKLQLPISVQLSVQRHLEFSSTHSGTRGEHLSGPVFKSECGSRVQPSNFGKRFQKFVGLHGVRRIRIHDMRHTAAVLGLEAGIRIEAISQALGHSRIDVTKSIYAPYVQVLVDEFTSELDRFMNESSQTQYKPLALERS
jgi:integrase